MPAVPRVPDNGWPDSEQLLYQFDQAWQCGRQPRIEEFLPPGYKNSSAADRRKALSELIQIDMEYRWRSGQRLVSADCREGPPPSPGIALAGPRLEDYRARYPELGSSEGLPIDLIGAEYRVRRRWGDEPVHAEYAVRFARQKSQ